MKRERSDNAHKFWRKKFAFLDEKSPVFDVCRHSRPGRIPLLPTWRNGRGPRLCRQMCPSHPSQ